MKYLYIANWKMNMSLNESLNFCQNNSEQLQTVTDSADIVLCPSFVALAPMVEILKNSVARIGAQNCSEYEKGSYTGEVSAQSLIEAGVSYCIVGHSERRTYFGETTNTIIKKINLLSHCNIQPIICVGETKEHFMNNATFTVLTEQLKPIIDNMQQATNFIIAYEPVWTIGTGIVPEDAYLEEVFAWIAKLIDSHAPNNTIQLLYGGSINEKNINQLKSISRINGFLVGGASTNFEEFKKIIIT